MHTKQHESTYRDDETFQLILDICAWTIQ